MINTSGYQVEIFNVGTGKAYEEANVTTKFGSNVKLIHREESVSCSIKVEPPQRYGIKVTVPRNRSKSAGILLSILIDGNKTDQRKIRNWTLLEERFILSQADIRTAAPRSIVISNAVVERPNGDLAESAFFFREFMIDEGAEAPESRLEDFVKRYMGKITVTLQHGWLDNHVVPRRLYGTMKNGRDLDAPIQSIVQDLHHHTPCYTHMEMVNPVIRTDDLTENTQFRPVESKYGRTLEFIFTYDNKPSDDLEHCGYPGPSERRIPHATTEPLSDLSPAPFNNEADPPHNSALVDENEAPQAQTTVPQRKGKRKAVSQLSASASRHTKQTRTTTATARVNPQVRRAPMPTRSSTTRLQSGSDPIDDLTNTVQSTTIHDPTDDPPVNQTRDQAQRERPTAVPQRPRLSQLRYEARLAAIKRKEAAASAEKWAATSESWDATVEMYRQDIKMLEVKRAMAEYPAEE